MPLCNNKNGVFELAEKSYLIFKPPYIFKVVTKPLFLTHFYISNLMLTSNIFDEQNVFFSLQKYSNFSEI
jgi:hypothetical protein